MKSVHSGKGLPAKQRHQERAKTAYDLREQGLTYIEVAKRISGPDVGQVPVARAVQLVEQHERWLETVCTGDLAELGTRARNALTRAGVATKAEVRAMGKTRIESLPNCGPATVREIIAWAANCPDEQL